MPIEDRNLKPGMKLTARYHKQIHKAEVIEEDGKLRYRLEDGRIFKTPSGAGIAVTLHACDGWHFWSVETPAAPAPDATPTTPPAGPTSESPQEGLQTPTATETKPQVNPATEAAPAPETARAEEPQAVTTLAAEPTSQEETTSEAAPAEEPGPAKKRIFRLPNQKGAPEGQTRWYCHDCGKSFFAPTGETPETCPQGHKA